LQQRICIAYMKLPPPQSREELFRKEINDLTLATLNP